MTSVRFFIVICELTTREGKEGISGNNDPMSGNDGAHTVMKRRDMRNNLEDLFRQTCLGTYITGRIRISFL